jgi:hypothetical protein
MIARTFRLPSFAASIAKAALTPGQPIARMPSVPVDAITPALRGK